MTEKEYRDALTFELSCKDAGQLLKYARENNIRLYTASREEMIDIIVRSKIQRKYHDDALRLSGGTKIQS